MSATRTETTLFLNREMSWLEFNSRVLEEAEDPGNPILERLRFFCIFHSNLDEFFMVRVASLITKIREGDARPDPAGFTPYQQLEMILSRVRELEEASYDLYNSRLVPALNDAGIRILTGEELTAGQRRYLDQYFDAEVAPVLTPIAIGPSRRFPHLLNLAFNLGVLLASRDGEDPGPRLAVVPVPAALWRLCRLPGSGSQTFCWLDGVIRRRVGDLFPGHRVIEVGGFRITRDSELEFDDEGAFDYMGMLQTELRSRRTSAPVRIELEHQISDGLRDLLRDALGVEENTLAQVKGPLDPRPLLTLVDLPGSDHLRYPAQPPVTPPVFLQGRNIFDLIREDDILLHHPYESFDPVIELLQAAAEDPEVLAVKQILYRISGPRSPVLRALMQAAENGKQVTVLVELTARFDEEHNIGWANSLEEAGAHVLYGLEGLKVHSKITLVVRREANGIRRYLHLGTGNYNEKTAKVYTDLGLLTASEDLGRDASGFFNAITGYSEPPEFRHLVMAPTGMRDRILDLIRREADRARAGQPAAITAKMNSLLDPAIIRELYAASQAGVPVRLNVRGICSLRPGIAGLSENIRVISIVDRYLEHSRAFVFRNGGDTEVYVSSADWMPRNLDKRAELLFPVLGEQGKRDIVEALEGQFADNQKARVLRPDGKYDRVETDGSAPLRVQEHLYRRIRERHMKEAAVTPVRFVPLQGAE